MQWSGISIYRLAEGKVVEMWVQMDHLGLLRQLGVVPE
jgi:predicted ester cyclase